MSDKAPKIDSTVADPARRYNYWLGGKDNYAVDRESGDRIAEIYPPVVNDARVNRKFHHRAVDWLTQVEGFDQFLDIGCGIPMDDDTHSIAQSLKPETRVVYVDHSPLVMAHARALLTSLNEPESVGYVDADLRTPEEILDSAGSTLDLSRPVVVLLVAVLHFLRDADRPYEAVQTLMQALPAGSALVVTHVSMGLTSQADQDAFRAINLAAVPGAGSFTDRSKDEVERFFHGLDFIGGYPGVVPIHEWRPDFGRYRVAEPDLPAAVYGGVACKT